MNFQFPLENFGHCTDQNLTFITSYHFDSNYVIIIASTQFGSYRLIGLSKWELNKKSQEHLASAQLSFLTVICRRAIATELSANLLSIRSILWFVKMFVAGRNASPSGYPANCCTKVWSLIMVKVLAPRFQLITVWPKPIWIKVNGWWQILLQHQSTCKRNPPFQTKIYLVKVPLNASVVK